MVYIGHEITLGRTCAGCMASVWEMKNVHNKVLMRKSMKRHGYGALVNIVVNLKLEIPRPAEWVSGFEEGPLGVCHLHNY